MKIVKITALWCSSCIIMKPIYEKLATLIEVEWLDYNYDLDKEKIAEYNLGRTLPVLIIIDKNDKELLRIIGEHKLNEILDRLSEVNLDEASQ